LTSHDPVTTLPPRARAGGLIPLYHATFNHPPPAIAAGLHNVTPDDVYRHLSTLAREFQFVAIDEFVAAKTMRGIAAVTFDDGYRCVIDEALPVFEALSIPLTIFLNGTGFAGGVFWRDKVRFLESHELVDEFLAFDTQITRIEGKRFYRYSKSPLNNSHAVDIAMDKFFAHKGVDMAPVQYCAHRDQDLSRHPLVSYGNHSYHHYVMSSLAIGEQADEIRAMQSLLAKFDGVQTSNVFAIPFGDIGDFNEDTLDLLKDLGYQSALLSRQRCHRYASVARGVKLFERFMPRGADIGATLATCQ
jgi:peptidoglycan/xylan/chitin deacetylase (PgdA/CDA1 family)